LYLVVLNDRAPNAGNHYDKDDRQNAPRHHCGHGRSVTHQNPPNRVVISTVV